MLSWLKFGAHHLDDNIPSALFSGLKCTRMTAVRPMQDIGRPYFEERTSVRPYKDNRQLIKSFFLIIRIGLIDHSLNSGFKRW